MLSSISPQRSDLPATFESLNGDTITTVLEFVGDKSYKSFGGLNKHCKQIYLSSGMAKKTFLYGYGTLQAIVKDIRDTYDMNSCFDAVMKGVLCYNRQDVLEWMLQEDDKDLLRVICYVAAKKGRTDLLNKVWNVILDSYATYGGKLNVLKWIVLDCANQAARNGHLHILQWLQEEKGVELDGELYVEAIEYGQFNVMKWLREQEVPFYDWTFMNAAEEGNLNNLKWLHDEGCPWLDYDYLRLHERVLKPEVIDWLVANGYSNKIVNW